MKQEVRRHVSTPEEVINLIRERKTAVLVVCRSAAEPIGPGFTRHYHCSFCNHEIQVSPNGRQQIIAGGIALCNPCGLGLAKEKDDVGGKVNINISPEARAAIDAGKGDPQARELIQRLEKKARL